MCHFFYLSFLLNNEIIFLWTLQEKIDLIRNKQCAPYYLKSSDGLFFPTLWLYSNLLSHKTIRNKVKNIILTSKIPMLFSASFRMNKAENVFLKPFWGSGWTLQRVYTICQNPICLFPSAWPNLPFPPILKVFLCSVKVSERLLWFSI